MAEETTVYASEIAGAEAGREVALDAYDAADAAALVRADAGTEGPSSAVAAVAVDAGRDFVDGAAKEMMDQLRREADAYVNPQTGKTMRWGDTWRHHWGGGVGVGRPESRPRRMMADGTTQIMPASTDAGYALVPTSSDKRALEEFYDECNGVRWSVQQNWGVGEPCANGWHGVVCHGGRVTEVWMNLNNVACWGKFNLTSLARLDELLYLDLSDNLFSGMIPEELFEMPKLQSLVLSSNRIEGTLSNKMGRLTSLRHLDLSANNLRGTLPKSMGKMKSLEVLYLGESGLEVRNQLSGKIPEAWSGMTSLTRLSLSGNAGIKGKFPTWIGKLHALEELTLTNTGLHGDLPESIDQCYNLRLLDVSHNKLVGTLPEGIARLSRLKHLRLAGNKLEGTIPEGIASLAHLQTLDLGANRLEGSLPASLERLRQLEFLDVSRNQLSGPLPGVLTRMPTLRAVLMQQNAFTGDIPDAFFTELPVLMHLYLDNNRLDGELPDQALLSAKHLLEFHAGNNRLTGPVSSEFGAMPRLASLQLRGNRLSGSIPPALGDAGELARLDLSMNALTGCIPAALGNASDLAEIRLGTNKLEGPIPDALGALPLLRTLTLEKNSLRGTVPDWLATHPCLREADLSANKLSGKLPESLWDAELDDGEGGYGAIPYLPARHDRPAMSEQRTINLGLNPLFCPLPEWADEVHATCRQAELLALDPAAGPSRGGTRLTVTGTNLGSGPPNAGCLFGKQGTARWVPAVEADDVRVVCVTPARLPGESTPSVVVRVGHAGEPITRFGELFRYIQ
uniref:IPT/TIG domain-containing protein n=1 Tax=Mantoniella antarctica TaxID=81844 RepID=A0A7S0X8W3_9CHLO|mmetsp:Transcript_22936/g.56833  ORF Transcript_22936/g.56833 Transcript_22936/m.56833 type:complete len:794 (+) Transcript_22936:755-3136(+)